MGHRGENLAEGIRLITRSASGVTTTIHFAGDTVVFDRQQEMEPILRHVQAMRERNAHRPFASDKELGHVPELFYAKIRLIADTDARKRAIRSFFKENPAFCAYAPFLKD